MVLPLSAVLLEPTTGDIRKAYTVLAKKLVAQLEIVFRFTPDEGSNPSLSAIYLVMARLLRNYLRSLFCHAGTGCPTGTGRLRHAMSQTPRPRGTLLRGGITDTMYHK